MNSPYTPKPVRIRATIFRGATSCVTLRLLADQELLREALQQEGQNQRLYAGLLTQTKPQIIKKEISRLQKPTVKPNLVVSEMRFRELHPNRSRALLDVLGFSLWEERVTRF